MCLQSRLANLQVKSIKCSWPCMYGGSRIQMDQYSNPCGRVTVSCRHMFHARGCIEFAVVAPCPGISRWISPTRWYTSEGHRRSTELSSAEIVLFGEAVEFSWSRAAISSRQI